jgi:hypothetical protein
VAVKNFWRVASKDNHKIHQVEEMLMFLDQWDSAMQEAARQVCACVCLYKRTCVQDVSFQAWSRVRVCLGHCMRADIPCAVLVDDAKVSKLSVAASELRLVLRPGPQRRSQFHDPPKTGARHHPRPPVACDCKGHAQPPPFREYALQPIQRIHLKLASTPCLSV